MTEILENQPEKSSYLAFSMPKIPLPANEQKRLAALASYQILDTLEEKDFDDLTLLASEICHAPISLISLLDDKRQWFKSHTGLPIQETSKEFAFCAHAITSEKDVFIVNDATKDERFADNPLVTGDPHVTFYAGVPLVTGEGFALGTLCVIDHQPKQLTDAQIKALNVLSKQVLAQLELRRKFIELEESNKRLLESNAFIQKFAATVAHDIKNPLSSMMLSAKALQKRVENSGDERSIKLVNINISSGERLLHLLDEMLEYSKSPAMLLENKRDLHLNDVVKEVIKLIDPSDRVKINLPDDNHFFRSSQVAMQQIFLNLFTNAIRYNDKPEIIIDVRYENDELYNHFSVTDNGRGIEERYFEMIFENNFTMDTPDRFDKKGTGIGLSTVKSLVGLLNGKIALNSTVGLGTTFHISLPS